MKNFVHGSIRKETHRVRLEHADTVFSGQWAEKTKGSGMRWIYRLAEKFCRGKGLVVGPCGVVSAGAEFLSFPGATPVDTRLPGSGSATDLSGHADGSMDYVFSSHCLEHVDDPEKALEEFYRVLKPGGDFIVVVPNATSILRRWKHLRGYNIFEPLIDNLYFRTYLFRCSIFYSEKELRLILEDKKFVIDKIIYINEPSYDPNKIARKIARLFGFIVPKLRDVVFLVGHKN
jgi:SAM-dependent methyltransferase